MATKKKTDKITEEEIIGLYMDYVLEQEAVPKSIYRFCRSNGIKEADFYGYFGSVEGLQKEIWNKFYTNTEALLVKNKEYGGYSNKDKMLTFFFSFFELMTLNRSYVLFALRENKNMLKNMGQLKALRKHIKSFAADMIADGNADKNYRITQRNPRVFSEGAWLQFIFILNFWRNDSSPGFEKTDLAIEKSVNTIFDVFDNTPLDSIIDFGKFLYKENFA